MTAVTSGGRELYCVVYEPTAREEIGPLPGETVGEFTVYTTAETLGVFNVADVERALIPMGGGFLENWP